MNLLRQFQALISSCGLLLLLLPALVQARPPKRPAPAVLVEATVPHRNSPAMQQLGLPLDPSQLQAQVELGIAAKVPQDGIYLLLRALDAIVSMPPTQPLRVQALQALGQTVAQTDWDANGCADFGDEESAKTRCPTLDPQIRSGLYLASVLSPDNQTWSTWHKGLTGNTLAQMEERLHERTVVRELLEKRGYFLEVLRATGDARFAQGTEAAFRQSAMIYRYLLARLPLAKDAPKFQQRIIRAMDLLGTQVFKIPDLVARLVKKINDPAAKRSIESAVQDMEERISERRKYLMLFSKDTAWFKAWQSDGAVLAAAESRQTEISLQIAMLIHTQAQTLRKSCEEPRARAKYIVAIEEYEKLLLGDPAAPGAYDLAWTLAETLWFAAPQKPDPPLQKGMVRVHLCQGGCPPEPECPAQPFGQREIKIRREILNKSLHYYEMVRDWQGPHTLGDDQKPLDHKEEAAYTAQAVRSLLLTIQTELPVHDPQHLDDRQVPGLEHHAVQDAIDQEANKDAAGIVHMKPQPLDPAAVDWILAVDAFVAAFPASPKDEPERNVGIALHACPAPAET